MTVCQLVIENTHCYNQLFPFSLFLFPLPISLRFLLFCIDIQKILNLWLLIIHKFCITGQVSQLPCCCMVLKVACLLRKALFSAASSALTLFMRNKVRIYSSVSSVTFIALQIPVLASQVWIIYSWSSFHGDILSQHGQNDFQTCRV